MNALLPLASRATGGELLIGGAILLVGIILLAVAYAVIVDQLAKRRGSSADTARDEILDAWQRENERRSR